MLRRTVTVFALLVAALCAPAAASSAPFEAGLERLSKVAVQHTGRIKPLAVAAAEITAEADRRSQSAPAPGGGPVAALLSLSAAEAPPQRPVFMSLHLFPTAGEWLSADEAAAAGEPGSDEAAFAALAEETLASWKARDGRAFAVAAEKLASLLEGLQGRYGVAKARLSAEIALVRLRPFLLSAFAYLIAAAVLAVLAGREARGLSAVVAGIAFGFNASALALYSWVAGRLPVNNGYEGMLVLAAALGAFALAGGAFRRLSPVAVMASLFAGLALLAGELTPLRRPITPAVPALQSLWLQVHVLTCFVAYAAFAVAFGAAIVVLVSRREKVRAGFDAVAVRSTLFGFVFLSVGILTGAAWARQAWGRYWGFDPKETWALVTWLIYAAYLHLAFLKGRRRTLRAAAAIIGFLAVLFTFIGVNHLLAGLHSYL